MASARGRAGPRLGCERTLTMQVLYALDAFTSVESTSELATPPIGPTATGGGPQLMALNSPVKNCAP